MKNLILFLALIMLLNGCSAENETPEVSVNLMRMPPQTSQANLVQQEVENGENQVQAAKNKQDAIQKKAIPRKLIKDGRLKFETTDIVKTRTRIMAAVASCKGYVSSDQELNSDEENSYTLILRVPYDKFESLLAVTTKDIGHFDNKSIGVRDVTADYYDLETRLKTKKEIERRYLQLLNKASTVKDILAIEKEAGEVRTDIESTEGQLKLMKDEVRFSTLTVTFYKTNAKPTVFSSRIYAAIAKGWSSLLDGTLILITFWPYSFLLLISWFAVKWWQRRRNTKVGVAV